MRQALPTTLAKKLSLREGQVRAVLKLTEEGATIPFIARYRKERTGSLDEVQISAIIKEHEAIVALEKRREAILESLIERELLNDKLKQSIVNAATLTDLEDIYLPYKPKRRTKATEAKEKGLEPLANLIFRNCFNSYDQAKSFVSPHKGVNNKDEAIEGALYIIAEWISENINVRTSLRNMFSNYASLTSKVVKKKIEEAAKFKDYFDYSESIKRAPSHRILAVLRGKNEGFLNIKVSIDQDRAHRAICSAVLKQSGLSRKLVEQAIIDCYKRLLHPSLENECLSKLKEQADQDAIGIFANNLKQLLMAPPLGHKRVLAIDPGFRTGCKAAAINEFGEFLEYKTIFPFENNKSEHAKSEVSRLIKSHSLEIIGVGNGTAGRETEEFLNSFKPDNIPVVTVDESGASIYSASETAREEFPDLDLTLRGAISIGRRLQDPLAELVKIDPKSIGVGQYQHDVDQTELKKSLDQVVENCVNSVGVDLNSASIQLLSYVAGLGPQLASNIIKWRSENGSFKSRTELKKVPRLGPKAFEQAAGFLRIADAANPLDASAVHPERYALVATMAKDLGSNAKELIQNAALRSQIQLDNYIDDEVGLPTLKDIITELEKPGRDPREKFEVFSFSDDVHAISDLVIGMKLPGLVTNITKFGAFVDIGVHQDGLVHISQMANKFIKDPSEIVQLRQQVEVTVVDIDIPRKRISLSMI